MIALLRRLWRWLLRRFRHPDSTTWEWHPRKCDRVGHRWGGWRRPRHGLWFTRRCRRRSCHILQAVSMVDLRKNGLVYKGGQIWRRR